MMQTLYPVLRMLVKMRCQVTPQNIWLEIEQLHENLRCPMRKHLFEQVNFTVS